MKTNAGQLFVYWAQCATGWQSLLKLIGSVNYNYWEFSNSIFWSWFFSMTSVLYSRCCTTDVTWKSSQSMSCGMFWGAQQVCNCLVIVNRDFPSVTGQNPFGRAYAIFLILFKQILWLEEVILQWNPFIDEIKGT